MIKRAELKHVLENAILAPSMLNMQPWGFRVREEALDVWVDIPRSVLFCDPKKTNLYLSVGAVLENIVLTAAELGYRADLDFFPQRHNPDFVAQVRFEPSARPARDLDGHYRSIPLRRTNRKRFSPRIVLDETKEALADCIGFGDRYSLVFKKNEALEKALLIADRIRFSNPDLVRQFVEIVKGKNRRIGLRSQNLEPNWERKVFFAIVMHTWIFLNCFGSPFLVPFYYTRKHLVNSSTIGWLMGPRNSHLDVVEGGRRMQRILLEATKLDIHSHIINYPLMYLEADHIPLNAREQHDIEAMRTIFREEFDGHEGDILAIFRLGYAKRVSQRAPRQPLESFLIPDPAF
jgi:nitroreductase